MRELLGTGRRRAGRRRGAVVAAGLVLALSACSGGDGDGGDPGAGPGREEAASPLPLPRSVATTGTITSPVLQPQWLERSSGLIRDLSAMTGGSRSGAVLLDDGVVVTFAGGRIAAVRLATGEVVWRSDLDLDGGKVCDISTPSSPSVAQLTFTFGDVGLGNTCSDVGRISTEDGHVVLREETNTGVVDLVTVGDADYLLSDDGALTRFRGEPKGETVLRVPTGSVEVEAMAVSRDRTTLVVLNGDTEDGGRQVLRGYTLPGLEKAWERSTRQVVPRLASQGVRLDDADGDLLLVQDYDRSTFNLVELDPATGEVVSTRSQRYPVVDSSGEADNLLLDLDRENDPDLLSRVGDDVIVNNTARGISRVARDGTPRWTLRTNGTLTLRKGKDALLRPGPLSADGRQVTAVLYNGRSTDLLALDVDSGEIVGRWAVPEEYVAGLTAAPLVTLVGSEGVLLTRNPTEDSYLLNDRVDPRWPFEVGYFTFPD